jgi:hypothetical protein
MFADNAAASAAMLTIMVVGGSVVVVACIVIVFVGIGVSIISGNSRRRGIAAGTISGLQTDVGST